MELSQQSISTIDGDSSPEHNKCRPSMKFKHGKLSGNQKIVMNISGDKFVTRFYTLQNTPGTRLSRLTTNDPSYEPNTGEFFFERNATLFSFILDFYRTGELHFPHSLCGPVIKKELEFWEIPPESISACCWRKYKEFEEEQETLKLLEDTFNSQKNFPRYTGNNCVLDACSRVQNTIWLFLEEPASSKAAMVWGYFFTCLLLLSIAVACMDTHPAFRLPSDTCPLKLVKQNSTEDRVMVSKLKKLQLTPFSFGQSPAKDLHLISTDKMHNCTKQVKESITNPKLRMYLTSRLHPVLECLDIVCVSIFALELLVRFIVWPGKLKFFLSVFNVMDVVSVTPMVVDIVLRVIAHDTFFWFSHSHGVHATYLACFSFARVLRAMRLLKMIKTNQGLQIIYLAVKSSLRELMLLCLLMVIGILVFSTMIYYAEFLEDAAYESIPIGFWWSLVTMTTVGYGDIYPTTGWGYVVGSLCAVTGMLATGLPIPVIANSFHWYYTYAKVKNTLDQRQKALVQETKRNMTICRNNNSVAH